MYFHSIKLSVRSQLVLNQFTCDKSRHDSVVIKHVKKEEIEHANVLVQIFIFAKYVRTLPPHPHPPIKKQTKEID